MPTRKKYHFENVFSKILCFVLIVSMLPLFKIDAQAATSMRTQYVWLVSKPGIYYIYDGKNAPTAYSSYDKSHRVTMQRIGKYWVTKDYLVVDTDYDDTTVPTLPNWKNTVFEYHGVAKTFNSASNTSGPYHWAGNISGGNKCEVDDSQQGKNFCGNYISSYDVKAPSSLGAHTTYKIRFQIAADSIKITKQGAAATSNVSCFLFASKVPLPDYNGGGGSTPDPEPEDTEATAKLSISAQDVTVNYKDFEVRGEGETKVTLDPSKSSTNADWVRYTLSGADNQGWKMSEKYTGSPKRQKYTIGFTKESIHYTGGTATCSVAVKGSTTVYADGDGGSANDTAEAQSEYTINITNKSPVPVIRKISTTPLADAGSMYDTTFYYVNKPVRIYDASYDPEYQSYPSNTKKPTQQYVIKYKGLNALVSSDFDTVDYDKDLFSGVLQDKNNRTIDITFTESGYYTIQTSITDELGARDVATKTIFVRNEPEPPTAVINSSDYTFVNYPFPVKDASTDPNNDIIKWQWDKVVPASEETTGAVSGTLNNAEYPAEGNKPTNIGGTLQFSAPGEYKIGLAVTDATNLTNHTEKTIKVIRDIPVAIVEPGPESKDNPSDSDPHYETDPDDNIEKVYVKQNRKLILNASTSLNPPASPIIWDKTEWVYGNSDTDADYDMNCVKVDKSSNNEQQVILVKDVGEFKVTLTLHNKYSDELSSDDPDLSARTKVIIVKVLPDEDPLTTIQVNNANPNFHDNPQSVEVTLSGTATSPDNDFIDYYNWRVYRDNNNDGQYAENELQTQINNTKTTQVKSTVKFETGNTSKFLSQVDAYERFGQETLDQFVTSGDIRHSSAEQEFEVNWRPCISYTIRDFAYVDDTLTITPTLRDENVETCTVEWTLMRKNKEGEYVAVDAASLPANGFGDAPIWQLGLHGGNIRITQDGYYRLDAVITDAEGHSEYFASEEIRIYDVPHAVISDKVEYRWKGVAFQFKESRKFTLDGNHSYADDSTGVAKHQINRALDEWSITPLDGQNIDNIYIGATSEGTSRLSSIDSSVFNPGKNSFDEVLAILAPGRYRVDYRVTNTYGKRSPMVTQEMVIVEDTAPIIEGYSQPSVKRGAKEDGATTIISISGLNFKSLDMDIVRDNWTVELIYDTGNDGFQNDTWETVSDKYISVERNTADNVLLTVEVPRDKLGKYRFRVGVKESFGQETLPIVPEEKRKSAEKTFDTQIDNVQPNGTFSTRAEVKGDVVFAVGDSQSAKAIATASKTFANRFGAEAGMDVLDVNVNVIETAEKNTFEGSFKVHVMWTASADIDSHLEFYDAGGSQVGHLYYGQKSLYGCSLDIDDRRGGTGEWLTLNFDTIPSNVDKIKVYAYGYSGSAYTAITLHKTATVTDKNGNTTTVTSTPVDVSTTVYDEANTDFGYFQRNGSYWDFHAYDGTVVKGYEEVINVKPLNETLKDVSWRDGAERFVIYVDDHNRDYMNPANSDQYAAFLDSMLASNVHLISMGAAENQSQLNALLQQLNEAGLYVNNSPPETAMDSAEAFIKSILRKSTRDTMYVLVNENLSYNKIYRDYNGDPQWLWTAEGNTPYVAEGAAEFAKHFQAFQNDPSLLAQKWLYFHNATYYDNSQGVASFSASSENDDKWLAHEVNVFDKVGKYEVDYRIKDNPVPDKSDNSPGNPYHEYRYWSEDYAANRRDSSGHITNPHAVIYVHRRPLAEYDFTSHKINDVVDSVDITNHAYDLDHEFRDAHKGLNLYEWKWKFASDAGWRGNATFDSASDAEEWINSQLRDLRSQGMTNILVQYRVRDIDGLAEKETLNITRKVGNSWQTVSDTTVRNQGAWSLPSVRWITNVAQLPVARFDTNNTVFGLGEAISVTDRSYSPNGDNIVKWEWTIERSTGAKTSVTYQIGSNVSNMTQMESVFSDYLTKWIDNQPIGRKAADNVYKVTLIVTDDKPQPLSSDAYSVTVKIIQENHAPTVKPPNNGHSIFDSDNPTVYEYDPYDANLQNPYYTYNGAVQKRGTETLNWGVAVDDPDNHDKYGTGNDSDTFKIQFTTDRFLKPYRTDVAEGATGVQHKIYDARTVTKEQAAQGSAIAPYATAKGGGIAWGVYRITTSVTDVPNDDTTPKTTEITTKAAQKPLHLYVIPKLSLSTPHFTFDGVVDNQVQIPTGEGVTISCETNDRSTGARILYVDGDGHSFRQEMTLLKTVGETSYWTAQFEIPGNLEAEDLVDGEYYYYKIETYTTYGSRGGEESRTKVANGASPIHILPIKLYDFTVTNITDPSVVFGDAATARDLAYDRTNSQNGALMKLGYAFNFDVYSKGMKDKDDYVRIRPTFYGYNSGTGRYDMQLDMYYLNEVGEYVLATTSPDAAAASGDEYVLKTREFFGRDIGSLRELKLSSGFCTKVDRNTQKWSARYGVPGTAVFVTKGRALTENSMYLGDVVIRFDIEAMKHGVAKYNYISKGQWRIERTGGSGTILNAFKTKYSDGDVIVIDGVNNAEKDFETRPVWTKLR